MFQHYFSTFTFIPLPDSIATLIRFHVLKIFHQDDGNSFPIALCNEYLRPGLNLEQSVVRRYVIRGRPLKSRSQDTRADPGSLGRWTTQVRYLLERRVPRGSSPRCSHPTDRDLSFLVLGIWREKTFATDVEYICEKIFIFVKRQPAPRPSCSKQQQPCDRQRLL